MNDKINTLLTSEDLRKYDEFNHIAQLSFQGFRSVKDLVCIRVFDFLNIDRNDNNCAEETLLCLYQYFYPDNEEIDEGINIGTIDQYFDFKGWRKAHKSLGEVTLMDMLFAPEMNMEALLLIFDIMSKAFYNSDEYDSRHYKYANREEIALAQKERESRGAAL